MSIYHVNLVHRMTSACRVVHDVHNPARGTLQSWHTTIIKTMWPSSPRQTTQLLRRNHFTEKEANYKAMRLASSHDSIDCLFLFSRRCERIPSWTRTAHDTKTKSPPWTPGHVTLEVVLLPRSKFQCTIQSKRLSQ